LKDRGITHQNYAINSVPEVYNIYYVVPHQFHYTLSDIPCFPYPYRF
jgi:hypothetical protein